jgi:hypothetical protein
LTFVVIGEFDPRQLAREANISGCDVGIKGESIREDSEKPHKETFWEVTVSGGSISAYDGMHEIHSKLEPAIPILKKYVDEHNLKSMLHIAIHATSGIRPAAGVPGPMVKLLALLNGAVTYDLYVYQA